MQWWHAVMACSEATLYNAVMRWSDVVQRCSIDMQGWDVVMRCNSAMRGHMQWCDAVAICSDAMQ